MPGVRSVEIQGDATGTVIITGDGNRVSLSRGETLPFHLLDERFRAAQATRAPADFYNGTRPNWANIALNHDAPRNLLDRVVAFAGDPQPPLQRIGVILALAGEGKTTLLMRAAWELASQGFPVLWRHHGNILADYRQPLEGEQRVVICIDELAEIGTEDLLAALVNDLTAAGVPFVLLGTARPHEWEASGLPARLARCASLETLFLERLTEPEVQGLLERLERANALGALADLPPSRRMHHFLDRLQADGQLLPALLTARRGLAFEKILESVFIRLEHRFGKGASNLLRGYAGIALVHRFGFWMTRPLLARSLGIPEARLAPDLLRPLQGELLEVTDAGEGRLYTRHPWVAEQALKLLAGSRLPEEPYLYDDLLRALGGLLKEAPEREERKLLTKLPLAFKREGSIPMARRLFARAAEANPRDPVIYQAWALLEKEQGEIERARELFARAAEADPRHAPTYQAWALLEAQSRHPAEARRILEEGLSQITEPRGLALLHSTLGGLLARQGEYQAAEEQFHQALELDSRDPLTHYHYAIDCLVPQRRMDEACRHLREAESLGARKARDRRRIREALQRHCTEHERRNPWEVS
ncbi:MAG: tetratricopeptide repeat protein [Anaerolineae bacterium]